MRQIKNENELSTKPTVLKFWSTWCEPCKRMEPVVSKLESEFDKIEFYSVNIDEAPAMAKKYRIRSLPTIIMLNNSQEISRVTGLVASEPLRKKILEINIAE